MTASIVLLLGLAALAGATRDLTPVHVVFLTDCTMYSNWQSIGDSFSFKMSGQPGTVSRVMCCTPEEKAKYDESLKTEVETWTAPSMAIHPKTNDHYAAYNKPEAVIDWLDHQTPKEDYVLVLDSDMILRRPFLVEDMKPSPGWAIGARYTYMIGVANELADRHIPEIPKRNDTYAGPFGRRADQVGGFFFVHRDDLKRMSHGWLKYTEDVRADTEAYRLSGDVYAIHPGDKPWISEMYGYAFGAATAGVWHHWDPISMIYPQYEPSGVPKLMHYGLLFEVDGYKFDKHWHYDFDVTKCPPWTLDTQRSTAGIFPPPPHPSKLKNQNRPTEYYRDLLSIETVSTLNAGFCDYHLRHCPPTKQLLEVCTEAVSLYIDTMKAIDAVEGQFKCSDRHLKCPEWAKKGECARNTDYMKENCAKSCGECHSQSEDAPRPEPLETLAALAKLKMTLEGKDATTITTTAVKGDPDARDTGKAADPDASKPQIIPHTEEKIVITQQVVHSPPPSPPPPSPPPPSPVVVEAPVTTTVHHTTTHHTTKSVKSRKDLLIRCYRMSLPSAEVKACAAAASRGEEWHKPESSDSTTTTSHKGAAEDAISDEEDGSNLELGPRNGRGISDHDHDDLRQLNEQLATPDSHGSHGGVKSALAGLSTWQAVLLWALVLVALLIVTPRLLRLRRRQRSGMRSE